MPFVQLETARAHYEVAGAGRNVLVLVHGNFASSRWWRPVLDRLPPGWRAYAMDLRGCGETAPPPSGAAEEYSIPRLASDLAAFADRLDLPAFHVGHSLGGAVALDRLGDPRPEDALASRAAPRDRADSTRFASGNWDLDPTPEGPSSPDDWEGPLWIGWTRSAVRLSAGWRAGCFGERRRRAE